MRFRRLAISAAMGIIVTMKTFSAAAAPMGDTQVYVSAEGDTPVVADEEDSEAVAAMDVLAADAVEAEIEEAAAAAVNGTVGQQIVSFASQYVGNPYRYGGASLTNGADCSGFVMAVFRNFGISLPHSSYALRTVGIDVGGLKNAQPGDIVVYSGHVGIYMGNNRLVHASNARDGIKISSATYRKVLSVRRVV